MTHSLPTRRSSELAGSDVVAGLDISQPCHLELIAHAIDSETQLARDELFSSARLFLLPLLRERRHIGRAFPRQYDEPIVVADHHIARIDQGAGNDDRDVNGTRRRLHSSLGGDTARPNRTVHLQQTCGLTDTACSTETTAK